ncbi:MAG: hypothetical protein ACLFV5_01070 [Anaerolineales bacterium]
MGRIRNLTWPLIVVAFVVGIGVGLVLGWQVWPVEWYNTDPSDLRVEHQMDYVVMTADSLAVTGDLEAARGRLLELTDQDTTWPQVVSLVYRVVERQEEDGDSAAALRIRRLAEALDMPSVEEMPFAPSEKRVASSPRWFLFFLGIVTFLCALGIVIWSVMRMRRTRSPLQEEAPVFEDPGQDRDVPEQPEEGAVPPPWQDEESEGEVDMGPARPEAGEQEVTQPPAVEMTRPSPPEESATVALQEDDWMVQALPSTAEEPSAIEIPPGALDAFEATYTFGDDDFDRSFSIESQGGEFLGECGLSISDIVDIQDAQRVDAFEVWLFDKGDIRTVSKVLVSKHVYEDEALLGELGTKGDLLLAEPGLSFSLDTLSLQVEVTVGEVDYLPTDDIPEGIFSRLTVRLVVVEGD